MQHELDQLLYSSPGHPVPGSLFACTNCACPQSSHAEHVPPFHVPGRGGVAAATFVVYIHTRVHTHIHTQTNKNTHEQKHTQTHARTRTHIFTRIHAHARTHAHTHSHTHLAPPHCSAMQGPRAVVVLERVQSGLLGATLSSFGITGLYITFV